MPTRHQPPYPCPTLATAVPLAKQLPKEWVDEAKGEGRRSTSLPVKSIAVGWGGGGVARRVWGTRGAVFLYKCLPCLWTFPLLPVSLTIANHPTSASRRTTKARAKQQPPSRLPLGRAS